MDDFLRRDNSFDRFVLLRIHHLIGVRQRVANHFVQDLYGLLFLLPGGAAGHECTNNAYIGVCQASVGALRHPENA